jgi:ribosomal protein S18 acetylase RimI-like enzyme
VEFRMSSEQEPLSISRQIGELMKEEKWALGFIPCGGDVGITDALIRGRVALCFYDGELAGYAAFTQSDVVRIHQCVVRDRYRGCGIGRRLIDMVAQARPGLTLQCKVRDDLHANGFWRAVGFRPAGSITHETSGSQLNLYVRFPEVDIVAAAAVPGPARIGDAEAA